MDRRNYPYTSRSVYSVFVGTIITCLRPHYIASELPYEKLYCFFLMNLTHFLCPLSDFARTDNWLNLSK